MENTSSLTKYFLMTELANDEMHGYDLINKIGLITGKKPSAGQIYPVLKQLKSRGMLSVRVGSEGRRKAKYYRLTEDGRRQLRVMQSKFEILVKTVLKERIKVCSHCSCEILSGAFSRKKSGKIRYFCCASCAKSCQ